MTLVTDRSAAPSRGHDVLGLPHGHGDAPPQQVAAGASEVRRRVSREPVVVFTGALGIYLALGLVLDFVLLVFPADAVSRLANGSYVLFSRDPHLAALGFVWNPLTSMAELIPLLLRPLWPALTTHDVAATIVSALAMAGAVHQLRAALAEMGVARTPRLVITGIFALDPMILYFGGNGMSEALYLFTLVGATRYILLWVRERRLRPLVQAGAMLGLAYLARNEAVASAALVGILVFLLGGDRTQDLRRRWRGALNDALIVLLPFGVTFAGWAIASFVITGSFFQQFQGNAVQLHASGIQAGTMTARAVHEVLAVGSMAPLVLVVGAGVVAVTSARRRPELLVPLAALGGGLAFDLVSYMSGTLYPWYRYYILTVPLAAFLVGFFVCGLTQLGDGTTIRRRVRLPTAAVAAALLVPGLPTTYAAMLSHVLGQGETVVYLGPVLHPGHDQQDHAARTSYAHLTAVARQLAGMHLRRGDVVVDNQGSCVPSIILAVPDPTVFVIPNDRDYQHVLADPLRFGARYLLVPQPVGINAVTDSLIFAYPSLYDDGAGFSRQVRQFDAGGLCPAFRLFRVTGHPSAPGSIAGFGA